MRVFVALLCVLLITSCQRDPASTDPPPVSPPSTPPSTPAPKSPSGIIYSSGRWKFTAFDIAQGKMLWETDFTYAPENNAVTYDNGSLYANTRQGIVSIDATTGTVKWLQKEGAGSPGRPVIRDTLLYTIAGQRPDYTTSTLYCLDSRTGVIVWKKPLQVEWSGVFPRGAPVVVGDKVIGVGHGGSSGAPVNSIYCFDRFNGKVIWYDDTTAKSEILPYPFSPDDAQVIFPAGIRNDPRDGFYSLDANTGAFLWHDPAMVITGSQVTIFQENHMVLFAANLTATATFNLSTKKLENIFTDTISFATFYKDKIFSLPHYYGAKIKCRRAFDSKTFWERDNPNRRMWDTIGIRYSVNSYNSEPVADEDYLYYFEYVFNGPEPSLAKSLFIYAAETGEIVKEIKLKETDTPLSKTFFLVRDGKVYYPALK